MLDLVNDLTILVAIFMTLMCVTSDVWAFVFGVLMTLLTGAAIAVYYLHVNGAVLP